MPHRSLRRSISGCMQCLVNGWATTRPLHNLANHKIASVIRACRGWPVTLRNGKKILINDFCTTPTNMKENAAQNAVNVLESEGRRAQGFYNRVCGMQVQLLRQGKFRGDTEGCLKDRRAGAALLSRTSMNASDEASELLDAAKE